MSLYPSLEDMQVDKLIQAQNTAFAAAASQQFNPSAPIYGQTSYPNNTANTPQSNNSFEMYPGLSDFMGLELSQDIIAANMPEYLINHQVAVNAEVSS